MCARATDTVLKNTLCALIFAAYARAQPFGMSADKLRVNAPFLRFRVEYLLML